jgi:hypothetical protein
MPVTTPSPSTTKVLGSIRFVEPPVWVTSARGASSSVTFTSIGSGSVDSPWRPATYRASKAWFVSLLRVSVQDWPASIVPGDATVKTSFS